MGLFLNEFSQTGNVAHSCRVANIGTSTVRDWYAKDMEGFKVDFEVAAEEANERIEMEILRRGVEGWEEPVWYKGEEVGKVRKFSDILLIFLAKARMPAKYRDQYEGTGPGPIFNFGSLTIGQRNNIVAAIAGLSEEELQRLADRGRGPEPEEDAD
jgi:hypothetical protein